MDAVKAQLAEKAKELGFGILGSYEFKKILTEKGFAIEKDITVYELCNPAGAQEALSSMPDISVYLPCRLSVYEENGVTTLATIGIEDMLQTVDADELFKKHMGEIFNNIRALMNAW
ncbi:MAG: DUF302 domain-containing protein [Thiovulaceae bacterium]|nr:DUF302 domain-containing protein [Sulfurimonadaceae bacterium]